MMNTDVILKKVDKGVNISADEALYLYNNCPLPLLLSMANSLRNRMNSANMVSWQIDRNINYTNVCISGCKFCNFHCKLSNKELSYTTQMDEYRSKIEELFRLGGDQILLQGGLHPHYDITFYEELFRSLKGEFPSLKLNALGPPEVYHISKVSKLSIMDTLKRLIDAGLDTLPGAGAEILNDRVRSVISPGKPGTQAWIEVMESAHSLGLGTTATMVYGHIETIDERIEHLTLLRDIQSKKPEGSPGFRAFICWPMQISGTELSKITNIEKPTAAENLKMIAISRIVLNNIRHIQVSWLTIGLECAKLALHSGADDMGSIMIEENVVSSAGAHFKTDAAGIKRAIKQAGFTPWLRGQDYSPRAEQDIPHL
jgi:cyclic dehypoxanthinyl futalosine synthase